MNEFKVGEIVEIIQPVRVPCARFRQMILMPGERGTVIARPISENSLMVISIEDWEDVAVRPDQVKSTGLMSVTLQIVTEKEIEAE